MAKPKIELVEHVGETPSGRKVNHGQYLVKADGKHIGYCGKKEDPWLAYITYLDDDTKKETTAAISDKLGAKTTEPSMVPPPQETKE